MTTGHDQRHTTRQVVEEAQELAEYAARDASRASGGGAHTGVGTSSVTEPDGTTTSARAVVLASGVGRDQVAEVLELAATGDPSLQHPAPRWVAPVFAGGALLLVPWIVYLAISLPDRTTAAHWDITWVGFDVALGVAMLRTAILAYRGRPQVVFPAIATATLLIVDAWFDVTTSTPGMQMMEALTSALLVELPMAALALYIAGHVQVLVRRARRRLQTRAGELLDLGDGPRRA